MPAHAYLPLDNERVMLKDMDNLNYNSVKFTLADIQILMCDKYVRVPLGGNLGNFPTLPIIIKQTTSKQASRP
jgi:hypothetical protein